MSKILQEVESYSKTYDGSYEKFQAFSNELKLLLKSKASIGKYILEGTIQVTKKDRGLENCYKQSGSLTTSVELLHSVVRTAKKDDVEIDVSDVLDSCAEDVKNLVKGILDSADPQKEGERLKTPNAFYPKSKLHPKGTLSEEVPWLELIEAIESDDAYERRTSENMWSTHEMDESGAFSSLSDAVAGKIMRTGSIPSKVINQAISTISDIVSKKLTDEAKLIAKLEDPVTGELKDGYQIYKILSNPTTNEIKNLIITAGNLFSERGSLSSEEHLRQTFTNCRAYEKSMESLKTVLPHSYIIGLGNWIRQFPSNKADEQALKTDVLSKDIRTLTIHEVTKCAQIRSPIDAEAGDKKSRVGGAAMYMDRPTEELSILHQAFVANSRKVLCFACGAAGHIARHCRNEAAKEQWKRDKPDQYEKFGKANVPCKFGKSCNRKDKGCRYTHPSKGSAQAADTDHHADDHVESETGVAWYLEPVTTATSEDGIDWDEPLWASEPCDSSSALKKDEKKEAIKDYLPGFWGMRLAKIVMLFVFILSAKYDSLISLVCYLFYLIYSTRAYNKNRLIQTDLTSFVAHGTISSEQDKTQMRWAKRLILDSGANRHMTGNRDILSNVVPFEMNFNTANGQVTCHEKGDISDTVKDVIFNPQVNTTLISVHQYLNTAEKPTVFLTTKKGVWRFDPTILSREQMSTMKPVATVINGTYTIMPNSMTPRWT